MTEAMVIDTNVLEHVLDPVINSDEHLDRLLRKFSEQRRKLCIDSLSQNRGSKILNEYNNRLQSRWKAMDERGQVAQWIRYVILYAERLATPVDLSDGLGSNIVPHMNRVGADRTDQTFVYVACKLNSVMVSNNARHITDLRSKLRRAAHRIRSNDTDFLSSVQAEDRM